MGHFPLILDSERIFLKDRKALSGKVAAMMTMADSFEENVEVVHPTSLSTINREMQLSIKSSWARLWAHNPCGANRYPKCHACPGTALTSRCKQSPLKSYAVDSLKDFIQFTLKQMQHYDTCFAFPISTLIQSVFACRTNLTTTWKNLISCYRGNKLSLEQDSSWYSNGKGFCANKKNSPVFSPKHGEIGNKLARKP